jgi:hypothetical protein
MKKMMIVACFGMFFNLASYDAISQDDESTSGSNLTIGTDLVSRYVWRGLNLGGSSPHIQPFVEYAFGESGLAVGAWGSYSLGLGMAGTEADLYISYSPVDWLGLTISDYFFPTDAPFERNDYFNYKKNETGHTFEAMITLGGTESFPLYSTFAINFYGADGVNEKGENYNAKYIELGYNKSINDFDMSAFIGVAPDDPKTDQGGEGWYGDSAGIINLGLTVSTTRKLADYSLPVFSSLIFNPEAGNFYIVVGLSF